MLPVKSSSEILEIANCEHLYEKLIVQLNKDFLMSNLTTTFSLDLRPQELKDQLKRRLNKMLIDEYDDYLNLMYRIDVPEKDLAGLQLKDMSNTTDQLTFVILKREFQKVWFKNKL